MDTTSNSSDVYWKEVSCTFNGGIQDDVNPSITKVLCTTNAEVSVVYTQISIFFACEEIRMVSKYS